MKILETKINYLQSINEYKHFIILRFFNKNHLEIYTAIQGKILNKISTSELNEIVTYIKNNYIEYLNEKIETKLNFEFIKYSENRYYLIFDFLKG